MDGEDGLGVLWGSAWREERGRGGLEGPRRAGGGHGVAALSPRSCVPAGEEDKAWGWAGPRQREGGPCPGRRVSLSLSLFFFFLFFC